MVVALAFLATAVATLFAQATLVRYTRRHQPQDRAWTIALAMFALASAALATGISTGWDNGTFRVFYLLGAVLNVPWLALGTVYLLGRERRPAGPVGPGASSAGWPPGCCSTAPMEPVSRHRDPGRQGRVRRVPPRPRRRRQRRRRRSSSSPARVGVGGPLRPRPASSPGTGGSPRPTSLIALGTLVLSSGGLVQGIVGHDEAFVLSLAVGISIIYVGFVLASGRTPRHESLGVVKTHGE